MSVESNRFIQGIVDNPAGAAMGGLNKVNRGLRSLGNGIISGAASIHDNFWNAANGAGDFFNKSAASARTAGAAGDWDVHAGLPATAFQNDNEKARLGNYPVPAPAPTPSPPSPALQPNAGTFLTNMSNVFGGKEGYSQGNPLTLEHQRQMGMEPRVLNQDGSIRNESANTPQLERRADGLMGMATSYAPGEAPRRAGPTTSDQRGLGQGNSPSLLPRMMADHAKDPTRGINVVPSGYGAPESA